MVKIKNLNSKMKGGNPVFTPEELEEMENAINNVNFKFEPKVGMVTNDCYLHGIGVNDDICDRGVIGFVGDDYFVLENKERGTVRVVGSESYWVIERGDFNG